MAEQFSPSHPYCAHSLAQQKGHPDRDYHDTQYGFPLDSDDELFGRLLLEINQAGLSWITILKKQANFRKAYSQFSIQQVANYGDADYQRLLHDKGIIRNRLKIKAAIHNAQAIIGIQKTHGSFQNWLEEGRELDDLEWQKRFKRLFKFTGPEIVKEFLMSTGYRTGAHSEDCPVYAILKSK